MAKKRNAKNVQQNASRSLLMSGLIVAAIAGVTPAMAATTTVDNATDGSWQAASGSAAPLSSGSDVVTKTNSKMYTTTNPASIKSLHVQNAEFYIGSGGLTVKSGNNVPGTKEGSSSNVLVGDNGKLYVGKTFESGSKIVSGGELTADNMTINGANALVEVSNDKKLQLVSGNLDIIEGTLSLKNGIVQVDSGSVNIEQKGTLHASGSGNLVNASGAVNLKGGLITVDKDGSLTIGLSANNTLIANPANEHGYLIVQDAKIFTSTGGTIKANMVVTGDKTKANFEGGTTTVDNLTVIASGYSSIANGATVVVNDKVVTVSGNGSQLEMKGGTLDIASGTGIVKVSDSGLLAATAGVNTIKGGVDLNKGTLTVDSASLTITKNLHMANSSVVIIGGKGTLNVDGKLSAVDTSSYLTISSGGTLSTLQSNFVAGADVMTSGSATNFSGAYAFSGSLTVESGGNLLLADSKKGLEFNYTQDYLDSIKNLVSGGSGSRVSGNLGLLYGTKVNASGQATEEQIYKDTIAPPTPNNSMNLSGAAFDGKALGSSLKVSGSTLALGGDLTLTGTRGGNLLTNSSGNTLANVEVSGSGSLTLGQATAQYAQSGTVGNITLKNADSTLTVTNGSFTSTALAITNGTATVEKAHFSTKSTSLSGGQLNILGTTANKTTVDLGELTAKGGKIFVDPAFVSAHLVSGVNFETQLLLGLDGQMNFGANDGWMQKQVKLANYNNSGGALGLRQRLNVSGNGQIVVDQKVSGDGKIDGAVVAGSHFGSGSLLVVDGNMTGSAGIINLSGATNKDINVAAEAKLRVSNALGTTYTIVSGAGLITSGAGAWNGANLTADTDMLRGSTSFNSGSNTITTTFTVLDAKNVYDKLDSDMAGMINSLYNAQLNGNVNNSNRGIAFLTRATRPEFLDRSQTAKVVEGAARMGAIAGVQTMTLTAANAGTSAATARTAMASPLMSQTPKALALNEDGTWTPEGVSAGDTGRTGVGLWIMPLYQSANKWGMKAGEFKTGLTGDLGGVAIGADYTINEAIRVGLSFNMGGGYAQSKGDFNKTDNKFNFWGINLYGGWTQNNFGLTADVGYTSSFNDVKQELPSSMQMGELKADITSTALTAGLRGEYKFETESVDIIPHVGVRFMSLDTYQFDTKNGGTVFKNDQSLQNIWTFPIGVTFAKDITSESGWNFKPQVDLQLIPAAGDVKAKSKVKVAGLQSAELNTRIMDDISYGGGIGLNLQKDNISFGINYNILMGEHSTDHGVYGTFRYEF